jgi:uncharacterized protein
VTVTTAALVAGVVAALVVGLSKTALPGAGLLAGPILATVAHGRLLPGVTLPILLTADVFAVTWFRRHARWDLLRTLLPGVALGFAAGAAFFVVVGKSARKLDITIGLTILSMVLIQLWRTVRRAPPAPATFGAATGYGAAGGFTTFVANAAGPVMNTYLVGLGLDKDALVGTAAWFYSAVNLAKVPFYVAVGEWSDGGRFFTGTSLRFDLLLVPAVVVGVLVGRRIFYLLPQRVFSNLVLVLSAAGALKLLLLP